MLAEQDAAILASAEPDPDLAGLAEHAVAVDLER